MQHTLIIPPVQHDFTIASLGPKLVHDIQQILIETQNALPVDQKHFIKPLTLTDIGRHIHYGFPVIGAVDANSGQIGGVLLMTPTENLDLCRNLEGYPDNLIGSGYGVVQNVAVLPEFGGQGLMQRMLQGAIELAPKGGIYHLVAKVADENSNSLKGFAKHGFEEAAKGIDPKLGHEVTYLQKDIDGSTARLASGGIRLFNGSAYDHANDQPAAFGCF